MPGERRRKYGDDQRSAERRIIRDLKIFAVLIFCAER
jgi:hypothetical protein